MPVVYLIAHGTRLERIRSVLIFSGTVALVSGGLFVALYLTGTHPEPFMGWLTGYGAGRAARDVGYGGFTLVTVGRALFAVIKNFVYPGDLMPLVKEIVRQQGVTIQLQPSLVLNLLALLAMAVLLLEAGSQLASGGHSRSAEIRSVVLIAGSAVLAFFLFGFAWNSSEEEFWFQITGPAVLLIALALNRPPAEPPGVLSAMVVMVIVFNNVVTFAVPRHAYPYRLEVQRLAAAVHEDDLVLHDGAGTMDALVYGARSGSSARFVNVLSALETHDYARDGTLAFLIEDVERARAKGRDTYIVGIVAANRTLHPWTLLAERFHIEPAMFVNVLARLGSFEEVVLAGHRAWRLVPYPLASQ